MELSNYIYGLIILGACVLVTYGLVSDLTAEHHYDLEVNTEYQALYDQVDDIYSDLNTTTKELIDIKEEREVHWYTGLADAIKLTVKGAGGGIKMTKLVWECRIYSKNFMTDFFQTLKNIVGGRLKDYETMLDKCISETYDSFMKKYPSAKNYKMQVDSFTQASIMVTIYGEAT